jgi:hypothetical protein
MIYEEIWISSGMILMGKKKDSEKNLSQGHSAHHKPHMDCPGRESITVIGFVLTN